jgi:DNA-binding SARP family transcriptional activator
VSAERLVDEVWGEDAPASATGSLQVAVSRLRGSIEPDRASGAAPAVLTRGPGGYALEQVVVDAEELSEAATAVSGLEPARVVARAEAALATLAGHRLLRAENDRYLPLPIA